MDNSNEHIIDIDFQENNGPHNRRKFIEEIMDEPAEELNTKKIRVNITNPASNKSSYVWDYFQTENGRDVCKIVVLLGDKEVECQKSLKHNGGTGNMKSHLRSKHKIYGPNNAEQNLKKTNQLCIDEIVRKVTPHRAPKQTELKRATTEWLVIDSLPFNVIHRKGYRKMIHKFDPAFILPCNKSIKNELGIAYQKCVLELKELLSITCETASITTDLWTARSNDGYIGVTLHWLTSDFEVRDAILAVERMEYPHMGERIKEYLNEKIKEFGLAGKIFCAITDNGANMKKAIRIWDNIERISCSAHTL